MKKNIEEVFSEEELMSIFKCILSIPSENPGDYEKNLALKIQSILEQEFIDAKMEHLDNNRANLYATLDSEKEGETLIFNGHLDTVPAGLNWTVSPFSAFEDPKGFIYGRGASDMKSGLASMIYATICLKRMGYPTKGKLILFLNADEEVSNIGMKQFIKKDLGIDYAIISEPTDLNIAIGHKGTARYTVTTYGTAGHAAVIEDPDNAIKKMNRILSELFKYNKNINKSKKHHFLGNATSNITHISGGTSENIIPDKCSIIIDRRTLPNETNESVMSEYIDIINRTINKKEYSIKEKTFVPSFLVGEDHILVNKMKQVTEQNQQKVKIKKFEATCEAPFFALDKSTPTIIYGPGSLNQAHTADERVKKSQVTIASKNFILICFSLLENGGENI